MEDDDGRHVEFGWYAGEVARAADGLPREHRLAAACRGTGDRPVLTVVREWLADAGPVADLGGGLGGPAAWFTGCGVPVVACVEPEPVAARGARMLFPELPVVVADGGALPLAPRAARAATLLGVLSTADDAARVLAEARRLVGAGGTLVVSDVVARRPVEADPPEGTRLRTAADVGRLLTSSGFSPRSARPAPAGADERWETARREVEDAVVRRADPALLERERCARSAMAALFGSGAVGLHLWLARAV